MTLAASSQVMTRYYGWYSNRTRGERDGRERLGAEAPEPSGIAERERLALSESRLRWAELLRRIFEVDPLRCPACSGEMRIVAFITERAVIDRILNHLRRRHEGVAPARGPPGSPWVTPAPSIATDPAATAQA